MKIFSTQDIRQIDRYTIENEDVTAMELVERVAECVCTEITSRYRTTRPMIIFAGPGNNGADALAVARMLIEQGFRPQVILFNIGGNRLSAECAAARDMLLKGAPDVQFTEVISRMDFPEIRRGHIVIDGIFGSGFHGEMSRAYQLLIDRINESHATVVSIDVPTGLSGDWNPNSVNRYIIHATLTLAVQFPRMAFFLANNADLVGEWKVMDIGLSEKAIAATPSQYFLVERRDIRQALKPRREFSSKADYGSAAIFAGSYGMMGAAVLAAKGALRSGVGKVSVCAPKCGFNIIQTAVPEALYQYNKGEMVITDMTPARDYDAIAIGPGIGTASETLQALEDFIARRTKPVILDADALNCIAMRPHILNSIPMLSILTPHAGEFDRLFGDHNSDEERLRTAIQKAETYKLFIILKGRYTAIVRPDGKIYFNSSGTPALATAGTGDLLTGMLASFMAQHYKPEVAAILAVYLHGEAGRLAREDQGTYGTVAGDVADNIGRAIRNILDSTEY